MNEILPTTTDQIPDSYWEWLKEQEMREQMSSRSQTETCAVERAPVIERLNDCVNEASRCQDRVNRLRSILRRAGMLSEPPSAEDPSNPMDRPMFSLQEIAMQLPGNLTTTNNEFSDLLDTLERQLVG